MTALLPLTARIAIAVNELRLARAEHDPTREWAWGSMFDRLLDQHTWLLRINGKFRPLEELDPDLAARLAPPAPAIRLVVSETRERHRP